MPNDNSYNEIVKRRWKCRTDLIWLCHHVLGMKQVTAELNGTMVERMQHFPKPKSVDEMHAHDYWDPRQKKFVYKPLLLDEGRLPALLPDPANMPGKRRRLLLDSRSFFKTSINIIGHSIQWILNYPDVAILVYQGNLQYAKDFLCETKQHFMTNELLREYFPEFCPEYDREFGNQQEFTVPARTQGYIRREPTMRARSIEQPGAGMHVEIIKFSDIVNEENSEKKERCEIITSNFYKAHNLLMASTTYWIDVEGTRYHLQDTYGKIIESEIESQKIDKVFIVNSKPYLNRTEAEIEAARVGKKVLEAKKYYIRQPEKRFYDVYINACYKVAHPNPTYDYDDMLDPNVKFQIGEDGLPVSRYPSKHPSQGLEDERKRDQYLFACQKLNNPTAATDLGKFRVDDKYPKLISRPVFQQNVRVAYYDIGVDTAYKTGSRNDFTAIAVGAIDSSGRCYIVEIEHGKFVEETTCDHILRLNKKYRPQRVIMEKENGNLGIRAWLQRKTDLSGEYLPIVDAPVGTINKKDRIGETLEPWYHSGHLAFLEDISCMDALRQELQAYTKQKASLGNDDILDALSRLFYQKPWQGRNMDRPNDGEAYTEHARKYFGNIGTRQEQIRQKAFELHAGLTTDLAEPSRRNDPYFDILGAL